MKRTTKPLAALAAVAALLALTASSALAHVQVAATSPGSGSTAKTSLKSVKVRFTGPIRSGSLTVTGPNSSTASNGSGGRDPRNITRLRVGLRGGLKAGRYKASWSIVAADGHHQHGSFKFKLKKKK